MWRKKTCIKCRKCGKEVHAEDRFCKYCGAELILKAGKSKRLIFIIVPSIICLGVFGGFVLNYYFDRSDKDNIISLREDEKDDIDEKTFEKQEMQETFKDLAVIGIPFEDTQQVEENLDYFLHVQFLYLSDKEYDMNNDGCIIVPKEEVISYINDTFGLEYSDYEISTGNTLGDSYKDGYYYFYNGNIEDNMEQDIQLLSVEKKENDIFELNFCSYYKGEIDRKYCFEAKETDTDKGFYVSKMSMEMNDTTEAEKTYSALIQSAGEASGEEFVSCNMSEVTQWPKSAAGYMNYILTDLDGDENKEMLIAYVNPENWTLSMEIWKYGSRGYTYDQEIQIGYVDPFSEIRIYSFYNEKYGTNQIFYSNNSVGSYTGGRGFTAKLFGMNTGSIEEFASWQWDDMMYSDEEYNAIKADMITSGIEYLEAGMESFGIYNEDKYQMLAMTEVSVAGNIPSQYVVSLQLLNHQQM